MIKNNLFPIAKEGIKYISYSLTLFFLFAILDLEFLQLVSAFFVIYFLFVFRNPERVRPTYDSGSVVSPVDGTVSSIEELENEEYYYKVTIDSSHFDVALLRSPCDAELKDIQVYHGTRLASCASASEKLNEKISIVFETKDSDLLKVTHILKQSIIDIDTDLEESKKLMQGTRYGIMVNGVTTLYLPQNFRLNVSLGDHIRASETLVGYFS